MPKGSSPPRDVSAGRSLPTWFPAWSPRRAPPGACSIRTRPPGRPPNTRTSSGRRISSSRSWTTAWSTNASSCPNLPGCPGGWVRRFWPPTTPTTPVPTSRRPMMCCCASTPAPTTPTTTGCVSTPRSSTSSRPATCGNVSRQICIRAPATTRWLWPSEPM